MTTGVQDKKDTELQIYKSVKEIEAAVVEFC